MYMEKNIPSYIEYEILCKKEDGCGFVLVNVDGDDVKVPISSLTDIPATKILTKNSNSEKQKIQFYYFSPFSIYARNIDTEQVYAFDPQIDPIEDEQISSDMSDEDKQAIQTYIREQKTRVPEIFQQELESITEYKKSPEFQKFLQEKNTNFPQAIPPTSTWRYVNGNSVS